ncbi:Type I restriction-modification system, DNA-methyltransferase subunit M [Minicystis rosea]|nr:Type I restriction-modification system, DNA-methyltransferase subunit M [Minicystis rosea]
MQAPADAAWQLLTAVRGEVTTHSLMGAVVAPLALLLAMRWADAQDADLEAIAAFNGEVHEGILPPALRWAALRAKPDAFTPARAVAAWGAVCRVVGIDERRASMSLIAPQGKLLHQMLAWVDALPFSSPAERRAAGDAFSEVVTLGIDRSRFGGELSTPAPMGRLMAALVDPQPGERIYDPCFGTGGLLVHATAALWERGRHVAAGEWARAQRVPVFGVEHNADLHLVGFVRVLLAGARPALELGDALEREAAGRHHDQGFDCVLADPPWGVRVEEGTLYDFPIRSKTIETLFLQHAVRSLKPDGRAVIALPPGVLSRGGADRDVRRMLLEEYRLEAVVRLPAKARPEASGLPTTLLLVRRAPPKDKVRVAELEALPDSAEDCRRIADALLAGRREAGVAVRIVSVAEMAANEHAFDPSRYRGQGPASLEELGGAVRLEPLGEVATLVSGLSLSRKTMSEKPAEGAPAIVRVSDVENDGPLALGARYLLPEGGLKLKDTQRIRRGDVLLTSDGTIGRAQLVREFTESGRRFDDEKTPGAVAARGVVILRADPSIDARYLHAVICSEAFQKQLGGLARGITVQHVPLGELRKIPIPVPAPAVQERVIRRLLEQPGDALEVLSLVLRGEDDDDLARLFREHPAFMRLSGDGEPEPPELHRLALEVLDVLRKLRNRTVHSYGAGATKVPLEFHPWLLRIGSLPIGVIRPGTRAEDQYEALSAASAILDSAAELSRAAPGLLGRLAARLTERLSSWAQAAQALLVADVRIEIRQADDGRIEQGELGVEVDVTAKGRGLIRDLRIVAPDGWMIASADEQQAVPAGQTEVSLAEVSQVTAGRLRLRGPAAAASAHLMWEGKRLDGSLSSGVVDCELSGRPPAELLHEPTPVVAQTDLGVSPYVTGDVVDDPKMFFGRRTIINDVRTHLGGGRR